MTQKEIEKMENMIITLAQKHGWNIERENERIILSKRIKWGDYKLNTKLVTKVNKYTKTIEVNEIYVRNTDKRVIVMLDRYDNVHMSFFGGNLVLKSKPLIPFLFDARHLTFRNKRGLEKFLADADYLVSKLKKKILKEFEDARELVFYNIFLDAYYKSLSECI